MATRLAAYGHELQVWDVDPDRLAAAAEAGLKPCQRMSDVAAGCQALFLCLPDGSVVEEVVFGAADLFPSTAPQIVVVDHSSIDFEHTRRMAARAQADFGIGWVDAPVSGGPAAASAGRLTAWLGGAETDVDTVRAVIGCCASKICHVGAVGQGQLVKSCNQIVVGSTVAIWSQMLDFAQSHDMEPQRLVEALSGGASDSRVADLYGPALARREFPLMSALYMAKDIAIVVDSAERIGVDIPLARAALKELQESIVLPDRIPVAAKTLRGSDASSNKVPPRSLRMR